jgi:hypothetical protein
MPDTTSDPVSSINRLLWVQTQLNAIAPDIPAHLAPTHHGYLVEAQTAVQAALEARVDMRATTGEDKESLSHDCMEHCLKAAKAMARLAALPCDDIPPFILTASAQIAPQLVDTMWRFGPRGPSPMAIPMMFGAD